MARCIQHSELASATKSDPIFEFADCNKNRDWRQILDTKTGR